MHAPSLMAVGSGVALNPGAHKCFYCGASCDERFSRADFVRSTFNDWRLVAFPDSDFVCVGCTLCLNEKWIVPGKEKPQRIRNYSWLLAPSGVQHADKSRLDAMRRWCLEPPEPPFAICLATSGQKQLLYRTPVNYERSVIVVQLEEFRVMFTPDHLADRLTLCAKLIAATGKPALEGEPDHNFAYRVWEHFQDDEAWPLIHEWKHVCGDPLSRLSTFLSPNKEVCSAIYPACAAAT